ncbi:hypothetical protein F7734_38665 [Scytonema sp. UIC 10036]|uniref:hypothetical protein n=1 Tax=Scytonema sp. UIC 10036 TaxID=2304196 RepID=UPI0012DA4B82|nr:hypothetical protein [Scytonema sp. UIC 10036]MUG97920.1 hypothetical protein [Scytonema sp. UIC 10036]
MGVLTSYLQQEFIRKSAPGWLCHHERGVLPKHLAEFLGYAPRVDVLLERDDGSRRLWIEFEISRADPVANHAKFATAHLFEPQLETDTFISMVSPHIDRGRRNLAANTILLMRHVGMSAFQTVLFPYMSGKQIKHLNHLDMATLRGMGLAVEPEIERALSVTETILKTSARHIHFVGDMMEVLLNLRRWNKDVDSHEGQKLWGKRTITYFVFDPYLKSFAPSKFCAYVAIPSVFSCNVTTPQVIASAEMTVELYVTLDGKDSRFDGRRAHNHLTQGLAMIPRSVNEAPEVETIFKTWLNLRSGSIAVHPNGPVFLLPPFWFK